MSERIHLVGGRVLTCTGDRTEVPRPAEVLIEGERIVAVASDPLPVDPGTARRIDLRGATVLPGLGDAHVHLSWPLDFVFDHAAVAAEDPARHALDLAGVARSFLESGYTFVIGAGVLQERDDLHLDAAIRTGTIPGPRIIPSGQMVAEEGGLGGEEGGLMEVATDARSLRDIVARQCDLGVKALKLFISGDGVVPEHPSEDVYMDDEMLEAAVAEADRHGAFITVHARSAESVAMAARTGVRIIHHACFLDDGAIAALEQRGADVWVCPGIHYLWAVVHGHAGPYGLSEETVEASGYPRELEAQIDGLRKLTAAGVPLLSGGDFGHQWTRHGTYAAELERYVELVDMAPIEAIHTATRNMGAVSGLAIGEVRPDAIADLFVVDGDPTADISVLRRPECRRLVVKGGEIAHVHPAALT
jgi:imidazolonepropionase-like amidohydrolase